MVPGLRWRDDLVMGATSRVVTAALIGALCGTGWFASVQPAADFVCDGRGLGCIGIVLLMIPALIVVWMVVGWGLLKLARFSPAWPVAAAGMAGAVLLMILSGSVIKAIHLTLPEEGGIFLIAITAAASYALAAVVAAGYGKRRDRAEHRGQNG